MDALGIPRIGRRSGACSDVGRSEQRLSQRRVSQIVVRRGVSGCDEV